MHRLFTAAAIIASGILISLSADAQAASPKLSQYAINGNSHSSDDGHKDWINLNKVVTIRWAPGIESRNVRVNGRILPGASGEAQHGALKIHKAIDKATPLLARAATTGRPLPSIVLILPATSRGHEGGTVTITNSTITGNQTAAAAKGKEKKVRPMETFSLNF